LPACLALVRADYPNKPIKILVPFPTGGTSDVIQRMMAEPLSRVLKTPVTLENVGGGGVIGTERGVKAGADVYTSFKPVTPTPLAAKWRWNCSSKPPVSSLQRNPLFPDVPTVAESGYPGFQALSWSGLSIQKGTPAGDRG
jgi:tripartite-type tricarboxylate transporter receptor subunit TctC